MSTKCTLKWTRKGPKKWLTTNGLYQIERTGQPKPFRLFWGDAETRFSRLADAKRFACRVTKAYR